jgi:hypothetical protein
MVEGVVAISDSSCEFYVRPTPGLTTMWRPSNLARAEEFLMPKTPLAVEIMTDSNAVPLDELRGARTGR